MYPTIVVGTSIALLYLLYRWALPKPIPGIPYDARAAKSLTGDIPDLLAYRKSHGTARFWFVEQALKHASPLAQFWLMPLSKATLVVTDYQEAQDVLLRRGKEFDRGHQAADDFGGVIPNHHIAMTSSDPRYKINKELVRDLMAPKFLNEVSAPEIYAKTMSLIDVWSLKAKMADGKPFEAKEDIGRAAMDIINAAAFSFDDSMNTTKHLLSHIQSLGDAAAVPGIENSVEFLTPAAIPDIAAFYAVMDHLGTQFMSIMPRLDHKIRMLTRPELRRNIARKDAVVAREIARTLARFEKGDHTPRSALDHLLQREMNAAGKAGRKPDFTSSRIKDEVFGYIIGGHETSWASLQWTVKLITNHQDVQHKLRAALRATYVEASRDSRHPTVKEITKTTVPYLEAVLEESLRYAPPLPLVVRESTRDTELLGRKVPKGTTVYFPGFGPSFNLPAMAIDSASRSQTSREKHTGGKWDPENSHLFMPERWLKTDDEGKEQFDPQAGPILSFGLGPRGCFGKRLAYLEMRIVLALLVWNFEFKELDAPFSSEAPTEAITVVPKYCYVSLAQLY